MFLIWQMIRLFDIAITLLIPAIITTADINIERHCRIDDISLRLSFIYAERH